MEKYLTPIECVFVRQTMLRQEKMYKEQVQELHHLYEIQKMLVAEIKKRSLGSPSNQEFFTDPLGRAVNHGHQFFPLKKEPDKKPDCSKMTGIRRTFDLEQLPDECFDDELESEANIIMPEKSCCNGISDVQLGLSCEWEKKPANFSMKRSREQEVDHSRIVKPKHQFIEVHDFASRSNPPQARNGFTFEELGQHSFGRERQVIDLQEKPSQQNQRWLFQGPEKLENSWNVRQPVTVPQNFGHTQLQTKNPPCSSWLQLSHAHERVNEVSSGRVGSLLGSYRTSLEVPSQTASPYAWREEMFSSALESNSAWPFGAVNRHQPTPVIITRGEKGAQEAVPSSWYRQQGIGYSHSPQNPHQGAVLPAVTSNSAIHPWQTSGSGYFSGGLFALPSASVSSPVPFTVNGLSRVQDDVSRHSWVLGKREPPFATYPLATPTTAPFKKPLNSVIKEGEVRLDEISQNLKVENGSEAEAGKVLKLQQGDRNGLGCNNEVYSFKEHLIPSRAESSETLKPFANLHDYKTREINDGSCMVGDRNFYRETGSINLLGQASYGFMKVTSACNLENRPWSVTNELQQNHKLEAESAVTPMSSEGDHILSYEGRPRILENGMVRPSDERDFVELMSEKAGSGSSRPKVYCNQELQLVERGRKPASEQGNSGSNGDGLETFHGTRQQCQGAAQSECGELSASIDLLYLQRGEKEKQDGLADDIAKLAASILMSLTLDKMPSERKESSPPLLKKSVAWFANTLCSNRSSSSDMEIERKSRSSPELDDFEAATLQLKGSELGNGLVTEQRKGQVTDDSTPSKSSNGGRSSRRGKQQRDFQNETLPSIASLSRQEITEDLQIMGGLMRSSRESARCSAVDKSYGFQSETAGKRGTKYFSISRAKVSPVSPLDVEDSSCGSPKKQGSVVEALPWLVTWGESTRRKRKQRQRICVSQKLRAALTNSKSTR